MGIVSTAARRPTHTEAAGIPDVSRLFSAGRLLLTLGMVSAPLTFGAVQPWAWAGLEIVALLVLLLWTVGAIRQRVVRLAWSPLYVPGFLFFLLGILQFALHPTANRSSTREALLKLITYLLLFFLATHLLANNRSAMRRFGFAVWIFAFLLSMFAIIQSFSSHGRIYWKLATQTYFFGPYVDHDHYAGLMEMLIPVASGYALGAAESYLLRVALGFGVLIPIVSVLISGSRGGVASLLAEFVILGIWLGWSTRNRRRWPLVATAGLTITVLGVLYFWLVPAEVSQRLLTLASVNNFTETNLAGRKDASLSALRVFAANPWIGTGLGSFETVFPQYQTFASDLRWDHAHDDYAEALAEMGVAGGVLILMALIIFFHLAFRHLRRRERHETAWIRLGAALGCCGMLAHSFVDFNFHIPANAAWFAVCVACGTADLRGLGHAASEPAPA